MDGITNKLNLSDMLSSLPLELIHIKELIENFGLPDSNAPDIAEEINEINDLLDGAQEEVRGYIESKKEEILAHYELAKFEAN